MLSKIKNPLSLLGNPILGPISPHCIPGRAFLYWSLIGTIKDWIPYFLSLIINCAKTKAWVAKNPKSPGQYFAAYKLGVLIIN